MMRDPSVFFHKSHQRKKEKNGFRARKDARATSKGPKTQRDHMKKKGGEERERTNNERKQLRIASDADANAAASLQK